MKSFILYSLSATLALTVGTVARAEMGAEAAETKEELTEGVISPDSQSPNNRETPDEGALEFGSEMTDEAEMSPTEGIISPDSQSPNNREIPDAGAVEGTADMESEDADLTDGIISPDSQSPNNREVPGSSIEQSEEMTFEEAFELFRETGEVNSYEGSSPTEGIISPDSQSPNNREIPDAGAAESMNEETVSPGTDGVISPDSQSPNNRAIPGAGADMTEQDAMETEGTDGIISPDSQSPNNREVPGTGN